MKNGLMKMLITIVMVFSFSGVALAIFPNIKGNDSDGAVNITSNENLSVTIELDAAGSSKKADWWIACETNGNLYSYVYPTGWVDGINHAYQGTLFNSSSFTVFDDILPAGNYNFYFGVDTTMNGTVDNPLYYDSVEVNVTEATLTAREYLGRAITTIKYYDYDPYTGQDVFIEQKEYRYSVRVFTKPPLKIGSIVERNPMNLSIYPDRESTNEEEGHIDIISANIINGEVLLQYWALQLEHNMISGILTDTHIQESAALNFIWAWEEMGFRTTWPFPMSTSTQLQGTFDDSNFYLRIEGMKNN